MPEPSLDLQEFLYETGWQVMLLRFKQTKWRGESVVRANLALMLAYIERSRDAADTYIRVFRVAELLRNHELLKRGITSPEGYLVTAFLDSMDRLLHAASTTTYPTAVMLPQRDDEMQKLRRIRQSDPVLFLQLQDMVRGRFLKARRDLRGPLERYLDLIVAVSKETLM